MSLRMQMAGAPHGRAGRRSLLCSENSAATCTERRVVSSDRPARLHLSEVRSQRQPVEGKDGQDKGPRNALGLASKHRLA